MRSGHFIAPSSPLAPELLRILSMVDCLYRLGCSEEDAGFLLDEWLEHGSSRIVGLVPHPEREPGSRTAVAA